MSLSEIKSAIDRLSGEDQFHLQQYLQDKSSGNEAWRREISRRKREMDAGNKFTSQQVEELIKGLEAAGN
ncbi:hypothetical protein BH20VER3_BH20VER3_24200 [soil metagenome]